MNILFIGPYRQGDGWGLAARNYLSCLKSIDEYTISSIPIYMSNNIDNNINSNLIETEHTSSEKYDVVIQNVLPNLFEKHPGHNIGIYYSETKSLDNSLFIKKINLMDELWVSSQSEKDHLEKSGVTILISIIPIPLDTDRLKEYDKTISKLHIPDIDNCFIFYILAEYNERKNIESAIIAFNREFSNNNDVKLIIKTRISGISDEDNQQQITNKILELKKKLRLYRNIDLYPNEILISNKLRMEQIVSLHKTGDCLLVPSRGEAYCIPALEALYFSRQVICTEGIHTESILGDMCTTVKSMEIPIVIESPPAPHIYTGWETWNEISILDLQKKMRMSINKKEKKNRDWVVDNFSYKTISNKIKDRLCQL